MHVALTDLQDFAQKFVDDLPRDAGAHAHVVGLSGELGAGKTTFVQHVARILGAEHAVTSPTFVFAQRYPISRAPFASLIHVDAYRLKPGEAHTIGWQEFVADPKNLILVEWPEEMHADFPADAPVLSFAVTSETEREIAYAQK